MSEGGAEDETDYDRLCRDFLASKVGSAEEHIAQTITDGIDLEHFIGTRAGKVIITETMKRVRAAILIILDPTPDDATVMKAIVELRVQHRVLDLFASVIAMGRKGTQEMNMADRGAPTE